MRLWIVHVASHPPDPQDNDYERHDNQGTAPDVADLILGVSMPGAGGDRADTGVGAVRVDGQHQPFGQHLDVEGAAAGDGADVVQTAGIFALVPASPATCTSTWRSSPSTPAAC
jgi:hypothetical protein